MARTPEGKVKDFIRSKMKSWYPEAWHYCPPGGAFGNIGAPDDIWLIGDSEASVFVAIEAKSSNTGKVTERQLGHLMKIKYNGGISAVVKGKDEEKMNALKVLIDFKLTAK